MHLNSGLLVRKVGESAYAGVRRFVIANRSLNYRELINEARLRISDGKIFNRQANLSMIGRLARETEVAHCRKYGIAQPRYTLDPPAPLAESPWSLSIRRNCPECAVALFHSPLYELPWLIDCPIHHCPLTTTCPACGKGWPAITDIWAHACPVCGVNINLEMFLKAANCTWDIGALQLLQRAVDYQHVWSETVLWAGEDNSPDPFEIYSHLSITPRNCFFPSVVSHFDREFRLFCKADHVHIEPCIRFHVKCEKISRSKIKYDPTEASAKWIMDCRQQVSAKIAAAVARCAGSSHQLKSPKKLSLSSPQSYCAFCEAFNCWRILIQKLPLRSSELFEWSVTLGRGCGTMPPTPQPMYLMTIKVHGAESANEMNINEMDYALPLAVQRFLYALDLWTTFVAILHNLEYEIMRSSRQVPDALLWQKYQYEPNYHESISRSIGFWKDKADQLHLCIPKSLLRPRLQTAFTDYWPNVRCENTN